MTGRLRLILFDVDGTLVDSQAAIVGSMTRAFAAIDHPAPSREAILSIVGLSLDRAMAHLAPGLPRTDHMVLVDAYKSAYYEARLQSDTADFSPLYPGAREILDQLQSVPDYLMGVATGKSQRGLDALIDGHGLHAHFATRQVADHHPSKPHPSMIMTAMSEMGVDPQDTVMIGDTRYDMDMAKAAGVGAIAVSWGYHDAETLGGGHLIDDFAQLPGVLEEYWGRNA